jgi:hypothetical protein
MKMEGKFNGNSMGKLISLEIARETAHSRMPTSKKQFNNPKIPFNDLLMALFRRLRTFCIMLSNPS